MLHIYYSCSGPCHMMFTGWVFRLLMSSHPMISIDGEIMQSVGIPAFYEQWELGAMV